ncbi:MAG TPA: Mut7-C RNAse domain-containing protein [Acidimicrobiia bacterium]
MAHHATLRFYAELKDFLSDDLRSGEVQRSFDVPGSVKDMIEACGVPHTEVELILANGRSVDFSYLVDDGDRISVYPLFESFDISPIVMVRPEQLRTVRFVADNHLGRLARYLRLLGLDTTYENHWDDPELVRISTGDRRILLTRDVELLKHGALTHGYYVRATYPREQVKEVVRRFHLEGQLTPFTRCMTCNGALVPVPKEEVTDDVPRRTRRNVDDFVRCTICGKVYWEGSHHPELRRIVASVRKLDPSER